LLDTLTQDSALAWQDRIEHLKREFASTEIELENKTNGSHPDSDDREPAVSQAEIAALAHFYWQQRGCPFPTSGEEDWHRAEKELKEQRTRRLATDSGCGGR
jgi:hypothetical protein